MSPEEEFVHALELLELPTIMDGELPPPRRQGRLAWAGMGLLGLDGQPLSGSPAERTEEWARVKREPGNNLKTSMWWQDRPLMVSTVFLGIDHQFGDGPPLIWETMIFTDLGWLGNWCHRYTTKAAATNGHYLIVGCLEVMGMALTEAQA